MRSSVSRPSRRPRSLLAIAALSGMMWWPMTWAQMPAERASPQSIEFAGVKDKVELGFRDSAALAELLKQTRLAEAADLAKEARHDIGFAELYTQPAKYRGTAVEVKGLAQRVYSVSSMGTNEDLFEIWVTIPGKGPNPFACIVEDLPAGFPRDVAVSHAVIVRGFFLKVIRYRTDDANRGCPLLVGRVEMVPRGEFADAPGDARNYRLPSAAQRQRVASEKQDRITVDIGLNDQLVVDGQPIRLPRLAEEADVVAERTRRNARAAGIANDANLPLPAILVFRAAPETPFATLDQLLKVWEARGFRQFKFAAKTDSEPSPTPRPARREPGPDERRKSDLLETLRTVSIIVQSDGKGRIGRAQVGEHVLHGIEALEHELESIFRDPSLPFNQASLEVDPTVNYSQVRQLVNALSSWNVTKISLAASGP
jgi:biopolymer transport protein ExbD